ncbi:unnamed protein product [Caenorhabditis bovis]|uniref:Galectin n=1 Tax=Caenorhabditis bovis TaxID=2654633 RepID=A0A8S1EPE1_9PELO|nr:unnamed protein product [Caenorhabditis bovis]
MLVEFLLVAAISISSISACGRIPSASILNCNKIKPLNRTIRLAQPMADGDEIIVTGNLFEEKDFVLDRKIGKLYEIHLTDGIGFTYPHQFPSSVVVTTIAILGDWNVTKLEM